MDTEELLFQCLMWDHAAAVFSALTDLMEFGLQLWADHASISKLKDLLPQLLLQLDSHTTHIVGEDH